MDQNSFVGSSLTARDIMIFINALPLSESKKTFTFIRKGMNILIRNKEYPSAACKALKGIRDEIIDGDREMKVKYIEIDQVVKIIEKLGLLEKNPVRRTDIVRLLLVTAPEGKYVSNAYILECFCSKVKEDLTEREKFAFKTKSLQILSRLVSEGEVDDFQLDSLDSGNKLSDDTRKIKWCQKNVVGPVTPIGAQKTKLVFRPNKATAQRVNNLLLMGGMTD